MEGGSESMCMCACVRTCLCVYRAKVGIILSGDHSN